MSPTPLMAHVEGHESRVTKQPARSFRARSRPDRIDHLMARQHISINSELLLPSTDGWLHQPNPTKAPVSVALHKKWLSRPGRAVPDCSQPASKPLSEPVMLVFQQWALRSSRRQRGQA
jgi:hypothetical protein